VRTIALISLPLLLALAGPAGAALNEGSHAPDFRAPASSAGKTATFSLQDARKKGPVVVYFYPSAYTKGCNAQAHAFATTLDRFVAAGATVVGVSLDSITRLNDFSADPEYCAGRFPVVSDTDGTIARSFGVSVSEASPGKKDTRGADIDHGFAERTTFVIRRDGTIAATITGVAPEANVAKALEAVQAISAAK
jgi:peroxiredoxin